MKSEVLTGARPVYKSIRDAIGETPLVRLERLAPAVGELLVKLEYLNPGGSVKDRVVAAMLDEAESKGSLGQFSPTNRVVAASVGNTAIALAMLGASRGLNVTVVVPDSVSRSTLSLLRAYGASVVMTPRLAGMSGAMEKARAIAEKKGAYLVRQFDTDLGAEVHSRTTAQELWRQTGGYLDAVVCGVGTGSTIMGLAKAIKHMNAGVAVVAVEPQESAVLSGGSPGPHKIYGLGPGFVPGVIDMSLIDEIVTVSSGDAIKMSRRLAKEEGILAGISSGATVSAAARIMKRNGSAITVAAILADGGWRYLDEQLSS